MAAIIHPVRMVDMIPATTIMRLAASSLTPNSVNYLTLDFDFEKVDYYSIKLWI